MDKPRAATSWIFMAAAGIALLVLLRAVQRGSSSPSPNAARPALTPGALNPDVTQRTIDTTICVRGWTKTIRPPSSYTSALKVEQIKEYGFTGEPSQYEEDHFISLELGGAPQDPRNLWPEARPQADHVDTTENDLNAQVCSGDLSLAEAQHKLSEVKYSKG